MRRAGSGAVVDCSWTRTIHHQSHDRPVRAVMRRAQPLGKACRHSAVDNHLSSPPAFDGKPRVNAGRWLSAGRGWAQQPARRRRRRRPFACRRRRQPCWAGIDRWRTTATVPAAPAAPTLSRPPLLTLLAHHRCLHTPAFFSAMARQSRKCPGRANVGSDTNRNGYTPKPAACQRCSYGYHGQSIMLKKSVACA